MSYKILVADDEAIIRRGIMRFLSKYQEIEIAAEAENGEQALEIVQSCPLDILFVDINMPYMNGLQFIEQMKKVQPEAIPVIISGYDDFEYARQALRLGVKEYILKPLMEEAFDNAMQRILGLLRKKEAEEGYKYWTEDVLKKNRQRLAAELLHDWLSGQTDKHTFNKKAEYLSIILPQPCMLTLFVMDQFVRESEKETWEDSLIRYSIENIATELYESLSPLCIEGKKEIGCLMLSKSGSPDTIEQLNKKMEKLAAAFLPVGLTLIQEDSRSIDTLPELYQKLSKQTLDLQHSPKLIREIKTFIEANYNREEISLLDAAEHAGVTPQHLSRLFKKEVGINFVDYLTRIRINKSIQLLSQTDLKIYEIAEKTGYATQHYYSSVFKKIMGISPAEYRKKIQQTPP